MALMEMDWCSWVSAHSDVTIATGPRHGLSLMHGPHPWNWKEYLLVPPVSVENSFTAHNYLIKVLLSQTGTDLLLSSECSRYGHLAPASTKDS